MRENEQKYRDKWRIADSQDSNTPKVDQSPLLGPPRPPFMLEATDAGLKLHPNPVKLSLCMIVRDNEGTIRPCLESIRPWVDEMIVVDTGSTDRTPEICRELGARVEHFPWCDDFSAARNESLKYARGEWIFWMDSDDTVPADCGRKLRELVECEHSGAILGYVMQVHCPGSQAGDLTVVDHVKLFRNRPDLRFEFRIHEQILPAIRRANGEVGWTDIYVVHSGSDQSPAGQQRKLERDFRILGTGPTRTARSSIRAVQSGHDVFGSESARRGTAIFGTVHRSLRAGRIASPKSLCDPRRGADASPAASRRW